MVTGTRIQSHKRRSLAKSALVPATLTSFLERERFVARAQTSVERPTAKQQLHYADDHVNHRPGGCCHYQPKDNHLASTLPRRLEQKLATEIVKSPDVGTIFPVKWRRIATPIFHTGMKALINQRASPPCSRKWRRRFHDS